MEKISFEMNKFSNKVFFKPLKSNEKIEKKIVAFKKGILESNIELNPSIFIFSDTSLINRDELSQVLKECGSLHCSINNKRTSIFLIFDSNCNCALDYLSMGIDDIVILEKVEDFLEYCNAISQKSKKIEFLLESNLVKNNLIGESEIWRNFLREVISAATLSSGSIHLFGETGTGKELVSRLIHTIDKDRKRGGLIVLDCSTIKDELAGSELFGHEKGSYTSAFQSREGAFGLADGGTLFMDEIGELPIKLQTEFLRVLQEKKYKKVGGNVWHNSNFRLVSATNKDIYHMANKGKFRNDLLYRITDHSFTLPSLKDRKEDIPSLVIFFLENIYKEKKVNVPTVDESVMDFLVNREYPGNIRELKQLVNRIALNHSAYNKITPGDIPLSDRSFNKNQSNSRLEFEFGLRDYLKKAILQGKRFSDIKKETLSEAILAAFEITKNNKTEAAEKLGLSLRAIQKFFQNIRDGHSEN